MENNENKGIFVRIYNWFKNLTLRGLLGALLITFIIIIILMSASYLPRVISRVSSTLSAALYSIFVPAEKATMTVDKKIVASGEEFSINFKKGEQTDGLFTVSYSCDSDLELLSVENAGLKKINCETPYYLLENETAIKLRAISADDLIRLVIDGSFENNESQKIEKVGVIRVTIKNDSTGTIVPEPEENPVITYPPQTTPSAPTYQTPVSQPVTYYYGKPDLAIRLLQTGRLQAGNIITNQNQFNYNDTVGIKFEVRNDGDANTGPWSFTAILPSISTPTYSSGTQISLRPGESIIFTLGFSNLTSQYTSTVLVNVDSANIISESNEYNNTISTTITNLNYNYNYNNYDYNYNNNNGCYINGVFTYNCYNYGYNYGYDWNYYNNNYFNVSCYAKPSNPEKGDRVRWYVNVSGDEDDYDYDWTGTDNLNSSAYNPSKTYNSRGWKYATVEVEEDNGYRATATCSVYVD